MPNDVETGCILEVDTEYLEIHSLNDYLLALETFRIKPDTLSPYQNELQKKLEIKNTYKLPNIC